MPLIAPLVRFSLERIFRLNDLLRPSLYLSHLRIESSLRGEQQFSNGNYAVFAIRPSSRVPTYIYDTLAVLNQLQFNVVIVTNSPLSICDSQRMVAHAHWIITRNGRGRDFGGFKDAILSLKLHELADNLILLNDSVYYIRGMLLAAFKNLISQRGFAAFTEVYEIHYHAQANCLFFTRDAIRHTSFYQFWKRYLPFQPEVTRFTKGRFSYPV